VVTAMRRTLARPRASVSCIMAAMAGPVTASADRRRHEVDRPRGGRVRGARAEDEATAPTAASTPQIGRHGLPPSGGAAGPERRR